MNELVRNFYKETANPLDSAYHAVHTIAHEVSKSAGRRFNNPNWDNSRELLHSTMGYDPISDWVWPRKRMGVQEVKERLNQILKVRHSFAHGFAIPSYDWTRSPSGSVRLTINSVRETEAFFNNLVARTDRGMRQHLLKSYDCRVAW